MGTKIPFDCEVGGYNRVQVDSYLKLLTEAYNEAFAEYELICKKYNEMLDKFYYGQGAKKSHPEGQIYQTKPHQRRAADDDKVEKTLEEYYREAVELDLFVDSLALK